MFQVKKIELLDIDFPITGLHFLNKVTEPWFAVMASCSLMGKHILHEGVSQIKTRNTCSILFDKYISFNKIFNL